MWPISSVLGDFRKIKNTILDAIKAGHYARDRYGINPLLHNLQTALLLCEKVAPTGIW